LEEAVVTPIRLMWVGHRPYQPIIELRRDVWGLVYAYNKNAGGEDPSNGMP